MKKIILSFLLIFIFAGSAYAYALTSFVHKPLELTDVELGIESIQLIEKPNVSNSLGRENITDIVNTDQDIEKDEIFNIALFGLDRRDSKDKVSRSDAIMIATIDFQHKKVKLTSLMRDQAVHIEGHGLDKLNHAYAYGGEKLALQTINQNFGLDIRDYATVDFFMLAQLIDVVGGVTLNVREEELPPLNKNLREIDSTAEQIQHSGAIHLTGSQAVAYSRIRAVGDGDFERTERQRAVLSAMLNELRDISVWELPKLWVKVAPHVETSLEFGQLIKLGKQYISSTKDMQLEQVRFPIEWSPGHLPNGGWIMEIDIEKERKLLTDYIYLDQYPTENGLN